MCYDVATQLKSQLKEAQRVGADPEEISFLQRRLDFLQNKTDIETEEHYFTTGFAHEKLPVITAEHPEEIQFFQWGLIPAWVKDEKSARKLANQTLNARGETIFEKPSFRYAAKNKRCLVVLSGYFEHYWADDKGKKKIPYYIEMNNKLPMYLSGLWEEWVNKDTGEVIKTVSIVTTKANEALKKVHNRDPNNPRMLNILPYAQKLDWLKPIESPADQEFIHSLLQPYPEEELNIYPVGQLRGKYGLGDVAEAQKKEEYPNLHIPLF